MVCYNYDNSFGDGQNRCHLIGNRRLNYTKIISLLWFKKFQHNKDSGKKRMESIINNINHPAKQVM